MRNPYRIPPFMVELQQFWLKHPDWRFGQMVFNIAGELTNREYWEDKLWNVEEPEFLEGIKKLNNIITGG